MRPCPEAVTNKRPTQKAWVSLPPSHWLAVPWGKQLHLLGTQLLCLMAGQSGTAHAGMRRRSHKRICRDLLWTGPVRALGVPEASLAVAVALFSAVVLIWLWALC